MKNSLIVIILSGLFVTLLSNAAIAQNPNVIWQESFGGTGSDMTRKTRLAHDGGFIMVGYTLSNDGDVSGNHGGSDVWVIKLDKDGNAEWKKAYGGSDDDGAFALEPTMDNGYILAAYSKSNDGDISGGNQGSNDVWLVKLDSLGNIVWQKSYGGTLPEFFRAIHQTADKGYIAVGVTQSSDGDINNNYGNEDAWVVRFDSVGNLLWEQNYGGTEDDNFTSLIALNNGHYIVTGNTKSNDVDLMNNHGGYDFWTVELDDTGSIVWSKTYGGSDADMSWDICQSINGNYTIVGLTSSADGDVQNNYGSVDFWMLQLNDTGGLVRENTFGGSSYDAARAVVPLNDGSYAVVGFSQTYNSDMYFYRIDDTGGILSQQSLGGSGYDSPFSILLSATNDFVISGHSNSNDRDISGNHGDNDYCIFKLNNPSPFAGNIVGDSSLCLNAQTQLSRTGDAGGSWYSNNPTIAAVNNVGRVTGVALGSTTITYVLNNNYGSDTATLAMEVNDCTTSLDNLSTQHGIKKYYHAATDELLLYLDAIPEGQYHVTIYGSLGRLIIEDDINVSQKQQKTTYNMQAFSKGVYYIQVIGAKGKYQSKFVKY